jgi:hypothetical protein
MNWQNKIKELQKQNLSIKVEKDNHVFYESDQPRLKPLFICFKKSPKELQNATVIDKVIGKAAAFICIMGKVQNVYTPLASQTAVDVLQEYGITIKAERIVPQIMNMDKTDQCPMEKMADTAGSPELFLTVLEKKIKIE